LFARVAELAESAKACGFEEHARQAVPIGDPSNPGVVLDHFYEISMQRHALNWNDLLNAIQAVMKLPRTVGDA
jgi:hypothetical protein